MGGKAQRARSFPTSNLRKRSGSDKSQRAVATKISNDLPGNWRIKSRAGTLVVPLIDQSNSEASWIIETDYEYQLTEPWLTIFRGKIASRPEPSALSSPLEAASPASFFFVSDEEVVELEKYRERALWEYGLAVELGKYAKECQEVKKEECRLCNWRLRLAGDFECREAKEPRKINQLSELGKNIKNFHQWRQGSGRRSRDRGLKGRRRGRGEAKRTSRREAE